MSALTSENLFLLEFMVVDIKLDNRYNSCPGASEFCVGFQFLDNISVNVCDGDFNSNRKSIARNIKNGKSCVFSLTPDQVLIASESFDIKVDVFKKPRNGSDDDRVKIGEVSIPFVDSFNEIIKNIQTSNGDRSKVQTLKNNYDILDTLQTPIGKIDVYIRLTCLGKSIVTQFQMNLDDKSILFKNKAGSSACKYKKANDQQGISRDPSRKVCGFRDDSGRIPANFNRSWQPYSGINSNNDNNRYSNCPTVPCFQTNIPNTRPNNPTGDDLFSCPCSRNNNLIPDQLVNNQTNALTPCIACGTLPNAPCLPTSPPGITPCIECEALPNAPCKPPTSSLIPAITPPPPPPSTDPPGNYEIIETTMGLNRLTIRMHRNKQKLEKTTSADCCCHIDEQPKEPQNDENKKVITGNSPFTIKMSGQGPNDGVTIKPPAVRTGDGTIVTEISDPARDHYILRIGKKCSRKEKKSKFDLEFCTPRQSQHDQPQQS